VPPSRLTHAVPVSPPAAQRDLFSAVLNVPHFEWEPVRRVKRKRRGLLRRKLREQGLDPQDYVNEEDEEGEEDEGEEITVVVAGRAPPMSPPPGDRLPVEDRISPPPELAASDPAVEGLCFLLVLPCAWRGVY
jgi:hypothetical protein